MKRALTVLAVVLLLAQAGLQAQTNTTVFVSSTAGTPVPAVGPGYVVVASSHADINVSYNTSTRTFSLDVRNDANGAQYSGTNTVVYAVTNQRTSVPAGAQWSFLGPVGGTFWSFPSSLNSSTNKKSLYLGWSGYGVSSGIFTGTNGGRFNLRVQSIENLTTPGAGQFYAYETSGGSPVFRLSSSNGYNNSYELPAGGHSHVNLALTAPGMFRVWFVVSGTLVAGGQTIESQPLPLYFGVEQWQIPSAAAPVIALSGNLTFGDVNVGQSATRTLTISNTGNATLNVTNVSYPTGFSGNWNSGTIAPASSTNINITFTPNAATNFGGNITVGSDATSGINTISANGSGLAPWVAVLSPGQPTFNGSQTSMKVRMQSSPNTTLNFLFTGSLSAPATWFTNNAPQNSGPTGEFDATFTAPGNHTNQWSNQMFFRLRY
jgi:hypothetical protein